MKREWKILIVNKMNQPGKITQLENNPTLKKKINPLKKPDQEIRIPC